MLWLWALLLVLFVLTFWLVLLRPKQLRLAARLLGVFNFEVEMTSRRPSGRRDNN